MESHFKEITDKEEAEKIFKEAARAECVGVAITEDAGNVLPLFAHPSGYGRVSIAYGPEQIYSILCDTDMDIEYLFGKLTEIAGSVQTFAMFDL